jgi:hypothetical protein
MPYRTQLTEAADKTGVDASQSIKPTQANNIPTGRAEAEDY